jgi:hypothetical protein
LTDDPPATEQRLLKSALALDAFNELTQKWGVNREELMRLLLAIPYCSNKVMPLVKDMGDVAVRKLPGRIRRWATMLEKLNAGPSLRPEALAEYASDIPKQFADLCSGQTIKAPGGQASAICCMA